MDTCTGRVRSCGSAAKGIRTKNRTEPTGNAGGVGTVGLGTAKKKPRKRGQGGDYSSDWCPLISVTKRLIAITKNINEARSEKRKEWTARFKDKESTSPEQSDRDRERRALARVEDADYHLRFGRNNLIPIEQLDLDIAPAEAAALAKEHALEAQQDDVEDDEGEPKKSSRGKRGKGAKNKKEKKDEDEEKKLKRPPRPLKVATPVPQAKQRIGHEFFGIEAIMEILCKWVSS